MSSLFIGHTSTQTQTQQQTSLINRTNPDTLTKHVARLDMCEWAQMHTEQTHAFGQRVFLFIRYVLSSSSDIRAVVVQLCIRREKGYMRCARRCRRRRCRRQLIRTLVLLKYGCGVPGCFLR